MASLSEAYGCNFSETPFEIIDDNFNLESEISQHPHPQPQPQSHPKEHAPQPQARGCIYCRHNKERLDHANLMLLVIIGLMLFIIIEKRLK
jgi:hypothetical protein